MKTKMWVGRRGAVQQCHASHEHDEHDHTHHDHEQGEHHEEAEQHVRPTNKPVTEPAFERDEVTEGMDYVYPDKEDESSDYSSSYSSRTDN